MIKLTDDGGSPLTTFERAFIELDVDARRFWLERFIDSLQDELSETVYDQMRRQRGEAQSG